MTYRLPPLNGLRAFEAAARHKSFRRAADELCVTPGAVSQHVKALESALGVMLFQRSARAIALTPEGRAYVPSIRAAFEMIAQATEETAPGLSGRKLRLGIAPPLDRTVWPALRRRLATQPVTEVLGQRVRDDPALLGDEGGLDALLRISDEACAGLHIERLAIRDHDSGRIPVILVTRPGIAGCRQHNNLVKLLWTWDGGARLRSASAGLPPGARATPGDATRR